MKDKTTVQLTDDNRLKLSAPKGVDLQRIAKVLKAFKPAIVMALEQSPTRSSGIDPEPSAGCQVHPPSHPLTPEEQALFQFVRNAGEEGTSWQAAASAVGDTEAHRFGWLNLGARGLIHYSSRVRNVIAGSEEKNHHEVQRSTASGTGASPSTSPTLSSCEAA